LFVVAILAGGCLVAWGGCVGRETRLVVCFDRFKL
jgi:hypothetical protein